MHVQPGPGESYLPLGLSPVELLEMTSDFDELMAADCTIICVPTSHTTDGEPDLAALTDATRAVAQRLRVGTLVIIESTVPPGTTRQQVLPILESAGLRIGEDVFLAFSPERIDPGNTTYRAEAIPKVVGGITPSCTEVATALYQQLGGEVHAVSGPEIAEMAKIFENTFRYVNIGLVNELALMCGALDLSVEEVIEACNTKPFAFMAHRPGPGVGGRCIPMAPRFLTWAARSVDRKLPITEAAMRVNDAMPRRVAQRVQALVRGRETKRSCPSVLLLGMAYKPNVADTRGSVAIEVAAELLRAGIGVNYHDPHVPFLCVGGAVLYSQELRPAVLAEADCVVLLCPHKALDYPMVLRHSRLVLDPTGQLTADSQRVLRM